MIQYKNIFNECRGVPTPTVILWRVNFCRHTWYILENITNTLKTGPDHHIQPEIGSVEQSLRYWEKKANAINQRKRNVLYLPLVESIYRIARSHNKSLRHRILCKFRVLSKWPSINWVYREYLYFLATQTLNIWESPHSYEDVKSLTNYT